MVLLICSFDVRSFIDKVMRRLHFLKTVLIFLEKIWEYVEMAILNFFSFNFYLQKVKVREINVLYPTYKVHFIQNVTTNLQLSAIKISLNDLI